MRIRWFRNREEGRPPEPCSTSSGAHLEEQNEETKEEDEESDREYPGWRIIIPVMLSLYIILFLVALDGTIIATAVPSITNQFSSIEDVGWYGSMYMMMRCAFVLVFGKLYSFHSPKWVLLSAMAWFEFGSLLCGVAPNSKVLIVGRAAAGVGAAGIFTGAMVAVKYLFPLQKRPIVMGLLGMTFTLSTVLGPLIGGVLTDNLSWRWCFYINLPLGGTGMLMLIFFLNLPSPVKSEERITPKQRFLRPDPLGFLLFVPSIISLLLALEWGGTKYSWSNPRMIVLLTLFAFLFICFILAQVRLKENATVPPRIARQRSIAFALWFSLATGGAVTTVAYYLPLWFQSIEGTSATRSGVNVLPNAIATMIGSISTGVLTSKIGYYVPFMISGPILMAIGSGLLSTLTPTTAGSKRIIYQVVYGLGSGGCGQQASLAAQTVLNDKDVAIGAALMMFGQMLGSAVFISVGQNVFATTLVKDLMKIPGADVERILDTGATEMRNFLSGRVLELVLQAYNHAITGIFLVPVGLACAALLGSAGMEWKSVKKAKKRKKAPEDVEGEKDRGGATSEEGLVGGDENNAQTDTTFQHSIMEVDLSISSRQARGGRRPLSAPAALAAPER
ncbi:hypothetical protein AJ80_03961 [Polytolypa hystricis UAMH7299]|uniref:Major facilitator superfamily (MFS) profile domain-containing protein n=1 Tax=Polytolypa hystricis (strain UAMH7299) TaxID=1447883 RepID=A0A2B7YE42_POLH7|nr:hypothetical protein AJ80_03961 [Polytolypa hystricis UAMH7299]